jgi:hypothetical protein
MLPLLIPRAHRIAAVHALPSWLAAHPDVDTPDTVRATRLISERDMPDPADRVQALRRFALAHDIPVAEGPLWTWAVIPISRPSTSGLSVDYAVFAAKANERVIPLPPPGPGTC